MEAKLRLGRTVRHGGPLRLAWLVLAASGGQNRHGGAPVFPQKEDPVTTARATY